MSEVQSRYFANSLGKGCDWVLAFALTVILIGDAAKR